MTRNSSLFGLINRHDPVHIDFSCYYSQPDIKSLAIKLKDRCVAGTQYCVLFLCSHLFVSKRLVYLSVY